MIQLAKSIEFIDLKAQRDRVADRVRAGWDRVVDHGMFIMGPEVAELEQRLAAYCGARAVVSCSSGTDAVWLPMLALGIGPGDAVFVPSWTFAATAEAVALTGATPVFVDVDERTMTLCPRSLEDAIAWVRTDGALVPRAIIPVDLFGMAADYEAIGSVALNHGLAMVADAAQSFGASRHGKRVGTLAAITATSFFPAKPLGCWGDGGAIFCEDPAMAETMRSLRVHGKGADKYDNVRIGTNARLDTLQAVVLIEKLAIFADELTRRQQVADHYARALAGLVTVPEVPAGSSSAWAQYTIRSNRRDALQDGLKRRGVPTQIYYPKPLHMQLPYLRCPTAPAGLPTTSRLKDEVLSLPMHPYLTIEQVEYICAALRDVLSAK